MSDNRLGWLPTLLFMVATGCQIASYDVIAYLFYPSLWMISDVFRAGCRAFWPLRVVVWGACLYLALHLTTEDY